MWTSGFRRGITVDFAPPGDVCWYFGIDGSGRLIGIIFKGLVGFAKASVFRCHPKPCNIPEE